MLNWKFKISNKYPIGLDIGHDSIKMIQLTEEADKITVLAADKVRLAPVEAGDEAARRIAIVQAIKQMLADNNFHGRDVISCVPNDRLRITSLRLAENQTEDIDTVLKKEAAQRFGMDLEKNAINYMLAGSVRHADELRNEWILFATDNQTIEEHIEMLEEAGLDPVAIDTVPSALFRSFKRSLRRQNDKENTVLFVDIGSSYTTVVFGRGHEISFVKQIPVGGRNFDLQIATKLGIKPAEAEALRRKIKTQKTTPARALSMAGSSDTDTRSSREMPCEDTEQSLDASTRQVITDAITTVAEDLAKQILLCFRYYTVTFRGMRVQKAAFAGGEAYEDILLNVLKRQLTVEVEVARPLKGIDLTNVSFDSDKRGLLCEWAIAVGLGLKGWEPQNINISNGEGYERN